MTDPAGAADDVSGDDILDAGTLDDDLLDPAAVAEGDPAADSASASDEELFVDGTIGRSDLAAERDEYKDALLRVKAEFDNFRKRTAKEHAQLVARANVGLVTQLLPVFDACDAALSHGATDVEPILKSLLDVLEREGLERMDPTGEAFDPNLHEAVMHEEGDGSDPVVTGTLRIGYAWKGEVLRAPMVKVRG